MGRTIRKLAIHHDEVQRLHWFAFISLFVQSMAQRSIVFCMINDIQRIHKPTRISLASQARKPILSTIRRSQSTLGNSTKAVHHHIIAQYQSEVHPWRIKSKRSTCVGRSETRSLQELEPRLRSWFAHSKWAIQGLALEEPSVPCWSILMVNPRYLSSSEQ